MKKLALLFYFFLLPAFVYVVQKTSWLDDLSGQDYASFVAILLVGILSASDIKQKIFDLKKNDVDWKISAFLLLFFIALFISIGGIITFMKQASNGYADLFIAAIIVYFAGIGLRWLYEQYKKKYFYENQVVHIIGCELVVGGIGTVFGLILKHIYYLGAKSPDPGYQSSIFTWCVIGGILLGGFIAVYDWGYEDD